MNRTLHYYFKSSRGRRRRGGREGGWVEGFFRARGSRTQVEDALDLVPAAPHQRHPSDFSPNRHATATARANLSRYLHASRWPGSRSA